VRRQVKATKRSDHEYVPVRKIDEAQNAIHHGVTERDERVNGTQRQAVDELLKELDQARWDGIARSIHAESVNSKRAAPGDDGVTA
jgi:hypothetical protein